MDIQTLLKWLWALFKEAQLKMDGERNILIINEVGYVERTWERIK